MQATILLIALIGFNMQVWDRRQSIITFAAALLLLIIEMIVVRALHKSLFYLVPGVMAAGLFYYFNMRKYFHRRQIVRELFPQEWQSWLEHSMPQYARFSSADKARFQKEIQIFLNENTITGIGVEVTDELRLMVASSAVLLLFGRPEWEYPALPEILIYPQSFDEEYQYEAHQRDRVLAGIMVPQNGIVLSYDSLLQAYEHPDSAYHVGLHEFAHALDLTDGRAEGIPGYLRAGSEKEWYRLICDELQKVREKRSVLNPYAGKNTAELFAVAVEHFFQRPDELKSRHRRLYGALVSFFNQDPAAADPS